jgi:hypothetical protein
MKCEYCNAELDAGEISCPECGKSVAKSKEDLQSVDPKATAAIGYSLAAIGLVAIFFVTINLEALTLSGLDYLVPIVLLVMGSGIIFYARGLKK